LSTWESLHREHREIFTKVNILEKALLNLLQTNVAGQLERTLNLQKDFLEAFERGITLHFRVEQEALYPEMRKLNEKAETLVDELLLEHRSIMEKYSVIMTGSSTVAEKKEIFLKMIKELAMYSQKEEEFVQPLVMRMSVEQLTIVDGIANRLGYHLS
jgi:Ethanolamine utilization protein EutJ (predicted chaperonin)